jgi:hypothetical protein
MDFYGMDFIASVLVKTFQPDDVFQGFLFTVDWLGCSVLNSQVDELT